MAGDTDTVELDFGGDFPEGASESIAAADALADALVKLQDASERVKDPKFAEAAKLSEMTAELRQQAALNAQIANFDANRVRALAAQQAQLTKMREDALGITEERARKEQEAERKREAAEQKRYERELAHERELAAREQARAAHIEQQNADRDPFSGAAIAVSAAMAIERAGEKLLSGALELGKSAEALAIAQTSKHEVQGGILGRLGGDYDQTVKMAIRMGIDPDEAVEQTKKLLTDKFQATEIPTILRIKAGMDLAGQNGQGLITELQRLKLEPKVNDRDIKMLVRSGIDAKLVYAELAKELGTNVQTAMAKVKAGTADTEKVISSIEVVAGEKFGKLQDIASNSVGGLAQRVKGDFIELFTFDDAVLAPIKDVLRNIAKVLEGPEGQEVKGAMRELFDELNHAVLDQFRGEEGAARIREFAHEAAKSIHELALAIHEAAPAFKLLEQALPAIAMFGKAVQFADNPVKFFMKESIEQGLPGMGDKAFGEPGLPKGLPESPEDQKAKAGRIAGADALDQAATAFDAGQNMSLGMADGIRAGESEAIEASTQMATKALQAAKDALLVRSPSEAFAEVGDYSAQGMAKGMAGHPGPASAAAQMAKGALGAANDNAGGLGALAAGGGGGGNVYNFQPQIVLPPGSPAATQAAAQAGVAAAYPEFLAMTRRAGRDR